MQKVWHYRSWLWIVAGGLTLLGSLGGSQGGTLAATLAKAETCRGLTVAPGKAAILKIYSRDGRALLVTYTAAKAADGLTFKVSDCDRDYMYVAMPDGRQGRVRRDEVVAKTSSPPSGVTHTGAESGAGPDRIIRGGPGVQPGKGGGVSSSESSGPSTPLPAPVKAAGKAARKAVSKICRVFHKHSHRHRHCH